MNERSLKILTYNILVGGNQTGAAAWTNRRDLAAGVIKGCNADIIGLQEPLLHQIEYLQDSLPEYKWTGAGREEGNKGEYSPIFYKYERLQLKEEGTFWMSETPEKEGSMGWDASYPRIASWARFTDVINKKDFFHFNTHFDHRGREAQLESAKLIKRSINEIAGTAPVFLTGDFNVKEDSETYKELVKPISQNGDKLIDSYYISPGHESKAPDTFHGFEPDGKYSMRIDYIFTKNISKIISYNLMNSGKDSFSASDHYAVMMEAEI